MARITYRKKPGCDHDDAYLDGRWFGWKGHRTGRLALRRCPQCRRENYVLAEGTGVCCWCGFDVTAVEQESEPASE